MIHHRYQLVLLPVDHFVLGELDGAVDLGVRDVATVDLVAETLEMHHEVFGCGVQVEFFLGELVGFADVAVPGVVLGQLLGNAEVLQEVRDCELLGWEDWVVAQAVELYGRHDGRFDHYCYFCGGAWRQRVPVVDYLLEIYKWLLFTKLEILLISGRVHPQSIPEWLLKAQQNNLFEPLGRAHILPLESPAERQILILLIHHCNLNFQISILLNLVQKQRGVRFCNGFDGVLTFNTFFNFSLRNESPAELPTQQFVEVRHEAIRGDFLGDFADCTVQ